MSCVPAVGLLLRGVSSSPCRSVLISQSRVNVRPLMTACAKFLGGIASRIARASKWSGAIWLPHGPTNGKLEEIAGAPSAC